jgi:apolipoprotein D and lipocalin family protein
MNKALHIIQFLCMNILSHAQPLLTVPRVELDQYAGKWYEIASYPQRFQKGCYCTTATYTLSDKGYMIVENRCNRDSINGKTSYIKGKAFVEEGSGNAKLKVQFFWPFKGKYWIIDLAADYSYAVVGHPNRQYLWILSRSPKLPRDVYDGILSRLKTNGFDTTKLQETEQRMKPPTNT